MKKLFLIASVAFLFASCGNTSENVETVTDSIVCDTVVADTVAVDSTAIADTTNVLK